MQPNPTPNKHSDARHPAWVPAPSRRQLMVGSLACAAALAAAPALAQSDGVRRRRLLVTQLADTSLNAQDVSKDFIVGSRAAWQDINAAGGIRGQSVSHEVIEVDGSAAQIESAWQQAVSGDSLLCFGTVGDAMAQQLERRKIASQTQLAHIAPWLQASRVETDAGSLPLFAHREEQLAHTIRAMSVAGMNHMAVVFASRELQAQGMSDIRNTAGGLGIRLQEIELQGDLQATAVRLRSSTAPIIVFVGGTPELVQFASGLQRSGLQRYLVATADVNLQTAQQMGIADSTPLIAAQTVPMVNSSLGIVRRYRSALSRYFDEPPTPHSLAGYIAAQATARIMAATEGSLTRASVLRTVRSTTRIELDGFAVSYKDGRRTNAYVTQSMLGANGRIIG